MTRGLFNAMAGSVAGIVLSEMGYGVRTWQWWVIILIVATTAAVNTALRDK